MNDHENKILKSQFSMFRFKQFNIDQTGCAMKINTDGVSLGAMADCDNPATILDIGTGTGVIALMLAQRFTDTKVDAVEIDQNAAKTAERNFTESSFANRLTVYPCGFESYFNQFPEKKYDLIVSNPPFYIGSLKSPRVKKTLAKHTDIDFFERLINGISHHLTSNGNCWLILPGETATLVKIILGLNNLYLQKIITLHSFKKNTSHREIICFGPEAKHQSKEQLIIYDELTNYSFEYRQLLKKFLVIF